MKISYDYSDIIAEFQEDLEDGKLFTNEQIWIVREDEPIYDNYYPIIDWYYLEDLKDKSFDENDKFKAVKVQVSVVLEELTRVNDIFRGI